MKCLVCGKRTKGVQMKHGVMPVCSNHGTCLREVDLKAFRSVPVVWVGEEDFVEHSIVTSEEAKHLDLAALGSAVSEYLWERTSLGENFDEALRDALQSEEQFQVESAKPEDLPLLIGKIKNEYNKMLLAERLKKGR